MGRVMIEENVVPRAGAGTAWTRSNRSDIENAGSSEATKHAYEILAIHLSRTERSRMLELCPPEPTAISRQPESTLRARSAAEKRRVPGQ
jgi:hypothetical protein